MAKLSKHFEVTISFNTTEERAGRKIPVHLGDITVCGVGYCYNDEENPFDFDIDEVFHNGINILPAINALGIELKERDDIYDPVMAHMRYLFSPEYTAEKQAQDAPEFSLMEAFRPKPEDRAFLSDLEQQAINHLKSDAA